MKVKVGVVDSMPGSNGGFTMAVFDGKVVPVGTELYMEVADQEENGWSKPGEKPPFVGVWETDFMTFDGLPTYQWFDGYDFKCAGSSIEEAINVSNLVSSCDQSIVRFRAIKNLDKS